MTKPADEHRFARTVDHLLGEGPPDERESWREQIAVDVELATQQAELSCLLERMRELEVEPSGRVPRELRRIVQRRAARRRPAPAPSWSARAWTAIRVAAVALLSLGLGLVCLDEEGFVRRALRGDEPAEGAGKAIAAKFWNPSLLRAAKSAADAELDQLLDPTRLPIDSAAFVANYRSLAERPFPDGFVALMSAENLIAHLRQESELRFSAAARAKARRANGTPNLDARIAATSAQIAVRVERTLGSVAQDAAAVLDAEQVVGLSFALRALVAAGSSLEHGEHAPTVRACRDAMLRELPALPRQLQPSVLAAISELAILGDRLSAAVLANAADDLARDTLRAPTDGRRPAMLSWLTPLQSLADAGRVLLVAPAFGTHAMLAFHARLMIAAHLGERLDARSGSEQPALVAAQLYGFGDLIDRREADRRLTLWRGAALLPDFVAMHHAAWSRYPVRSGWASFQRELRQIAGVPTPDGLSDASALLLTLCTNTAAPGLREGLGDTVL